MRTPQDVTNYLAAEKAKTERERIEWIKEQEDLVQKCIEASTKKGSLNNCGGKVVIPGPTGVNSELIIGIFSRYGWQATYAPRSERVDASQGSCMATYYEYNLEPSRSR